MKLFIDTGPIVAYYNMDDTYHQKASEIFQKMSDGSLTFADLYISDYIFDEAVTVISTRTGNYDLAIKLGNALKNSHIIHMLKVDERIFEMAWRQFIKLKGSGISFTDCTSIVLMKEYKIKTAFSYDKHFRMHRGIKVIQ